MKRLQWQGLKNIERSATGRNSNVSIYCHEMIEISKVSSMFLELQCCVTWLKYFRVVLYGLLLVNAGFEWSTFESVSILSFPDASVWWNMTPWSMFCLSNRRTRTLLHSPCWWTEKIIFKITKKHIHFTAIGFLIESLVVPNGLAHIGQRAILLHNGGHTVFWICWPALFLLQPNCFSDEMIQICPNRQNFQKGDGFEK